MPIFGPFCDFRGQPGRKAYPEKRISMNRTVQRAAVDVQARFSSGFSLAASPDASLSLRSAALNPFLGRCRPAATTSARAATWRSEFSQLLETPPNPNSPRHLRGPAPPSDEHPNPGTDRRTPAESPNFLHDVFLNLEPMTAALRLSRDFYSSTSARSATTASKTIWPSPPSTPTRTSSSAWPSGSTTAVPPDAPRDPPEYARPWSR
jgi:hypothetical protein